MGLLILNAFKGLKSKKIQMMCIIFCIILSTAIYTIMNTALDRMEDRYHNYLKEQNVEDFSFEPKIDYSKDYTVAEVEELKKNELKDISKEQMQLIDMYLMSLKIKDMPGEHTIPNIEKVYKGVDYIMNTNGANTKKVEEMILPIEEKYDFKYLVETSKVVTSDKNLYKAVPYNLNKAVNIPYLVEGKMPELNNEITILPNYAKANNIKIGDTQKIGEVTYNVVGFAYVPDHIFPLISYNRPMYNEKTDNIIYMNDSTFEAFPGIKEVAYVGAFNDREKTFDIKTLEAMFKDEARIGLSPIAAVRIMRINTLEAEIKMNRTFATYFLYLLLIISIFIIVVITKKRIDDERLQIGVLKALGYKSFSIALSYLIYPIFGSILGGIIGFLIGIGTHNILTELYVSYFNLPISGFKVNFNYLTSSVFVPMILLSILTFLISMFMLRKKPLALLKEGSNLKVNIFSKFVSFATRKLNFKTRFRYSLASRSIGKLFTVALTSFCTGLLIVLVLIGMNMFSSMILKTFDGLNFDNMVSYITVQDGVASAKEDLIYEANLKLEEVRKQDNTIHKIQRENDYNIKIDGIDKLNVSSIKSEAENDISTKLSSPTDIIINTNVAKIAGADIGDMLVFKINEKEYTYNVVGIQNSFMGNAAYVKREEFANIFEKDKKNAYNMKYTNDTKYSNMANLSNEELENIAAIFSVSDLKNNMETQISSSNGSIYFIIGFASVLALVIILVIANVIIEENKKTISLMKVMGYSNKTISQIVLNIYTPVVVIAYILAIPVMKYILENIVEVLTKDMTYAIPIEFSLAKALIGLAGLLIAYYTAIFVSRKTLNKVPLSVALKRE